VQVFLFGIYDKPWWHYRDRGPPIARPRSPSTPRSPGSANLGYSLIEQRDFVENRLPSGPRSSAERFPRDLDGVDLEWDLEGAVFCKSTRLRTVATARTAHSWAEPNLPIELSTSRTRSETTTSFPVPPLGTGYPALGRRRIRVRALARS